MTLGLLALLVLVDGAFCGFRSAAGRNPRIYLRPYYLRSMRRGAAFAAAVIAIFLSIAFLLDPQWSALTAGADRMLTVYGVYATLTLAALALYVVGPFDLTVLASVLVLGPFTLARPFVIVGGGIYAAWGAPPLVAGYAMAAAATMVGFERLLELGNPPWRRLPIPGR